VRSFLLEIQRSRVHAISQPRGTGTIRKQMPQMRTALCAQHFCSHHAVGCVGFGADVFLDGRRGKAWPSGAGFELGIRPEQLRATADAAVNAFFVIVPIAPGEGRLGALLPRDVVLLWRELLLPFRFGLGDLFLPNLSLHRAVLARPFLTTVNSHSGTILVSR
jgi:hypothetical protein